MSRRSCRKIAFLGGVSPPAWLARSRWPRPRTGAGRYFQQNRTEFGSEPFPLQGLAQHGQVLASPLLVFTLGMLVRGHLLPSLRAGIRRGRATGISIAAILGPMILSGYGLQVCVEPAWRTTLAWVHGPSSLLFLSAYLIHLISPRATPKPAWFP